MFEEIEDDDDFLKDDGNLGIEILSHLVEFLGVCFYCLILHFLHIL